jgi:hypothetical protein
VTFPLQPVRRCQSYVTNLLCPLTSLVEQGICTTVQAPIFLPHYKQTLATIAHLYLRPVSQMKTAIQQRLHRDSLRQATNRSTASSLACRTETQSDGPVSDPYVSA